jgi:hypothetical protein
MEEKDGEDFLVVLQDKKTYKCEPIEKNMSSEKVVSIKIVKGEQLSEAVRGTLGIKSDDFAEIRVIRNSPAKPRVTKIEGSPSSGFVSAIDSSSLRGFQFE